MKLTFLHAAAAAVALAACATSPAQVHYDTGTALLASETALDVAAKAATAAVQSRLTTKAEDAQIAELTAPCPAGVTQETITLVIAKQSCPVKGALLLTRQAYKASDAASWPALIANLAALTAQLTNLHP